MFISPKKMVKINWKGVFSNPTLTLMQYLLCADLHWGSESVNLILCSTTFHLIVQTQLFWTHFIIHCKIRCPHMTAVRQNCTLELSHDAKVLRDSSRPVIAVSPPTFPVKGLFAHYDSRLKKMSFCPLHPTTWKYFICIIWYTWEEV